MIFFKLKTRKKEESNLNCAIIQKRFLNGSVLVPPSKSFSHRAIICAALAGKESFISPLVFSQDILATIGAMKSLGAEIEIFENKIKIKGFKKPAKEVSVDCFDSGSTLRFLVPVAAALGIKTVFKRSESLAKRPIDDLLNALEKAGIKCEKNEDFSLKISGKISPGEFSLPGNVSSQFVSGLLLALPMLDGNSKIKLTSPLESSGYVEITKEVMKKFGVLVEKTLDGFFIKGNQVYRPFDYNVEGDWSQAAFFMAMGVLGGSISVKGLSKNSSQADKMIFDFLEKFGADISWNKDEIKVNKSKLKSINIDAAEVPDLVPVLAVLAASAEGETTIKNVKRLKFKECDRLSAISEELAKIGVKIKYSENELRIMGGKNYCGCEVSSHNDHRIAMAMAAMASCIEGSITILNSGCVKKSYPDFFKDYCLLGGAADVFDVGE